MKAPKFEAGKIYHLSHKGGAPADIYIEMVYMRSRSTEWMYRIISEANNGEMAFVSESALAERISKRTSKVYNKDSVIELLDNGYRFAGNAVGIDSARQLGEEFAKNPNIHDVMLYNALDSNGEETDGYGIWIRWNMVIDQRYNGEQTPIKIK